MKPESVAFLDHGLVAFAQTLFMLRDGKVQAFVAAVREREDLEDARDRAALKRNLRKRKRYSFLKEAAPVAVEFWERWLKEELEGSEVPEDWGGVFETFELKDPAKLVRIMAEGMGRTVADVAARSARVISRYVVAGFVEIPEPCGLRTTFVGPWPPGSEEGVLMVMVWGLSDIRAVKRELGRQYTAMLGKERHKLPEKGDETLWLRFCAEMAGEEGEVKAGNYRWRAELAWELPGGRKPRGRPLDPGYEEALAREADRIKHNDEYWEKKGKPGLIGPGED